MFLIGRLLIVIVVSFTNAKFNFFWGGWRVADFHWVLHALLVIFIAVAGLFLIFSVCG